MNTSYFPTTLVRPALPSWRLPQPSLEALAGTFSPISLAQMDSVALLDRTDTKFLLDSAQLLQALSALHSNYWMLSIDGRRLNHYRTLYFDTPDFALYRLHVNGRLDRYKVRSREYTDSSLSFLEVKHKTNKGRTLKSRLPTSQPLDWLTPEAEDWLGGVYPYDGRSLEPRLTNTFSRLTLVSKAYCERVTIDVDLGFTSAGKARRLDGLVIAEVKLDRSGCPSPFLAQMRLQKIHPRGFSKYCIGVSLLYDGIKKNALKPKLLSVEKMTRGVLFHD